MGMSIRKCDGSLPKFLFGKNSLKTKRRALKPLRHKALRGAIARNRYSGKSLGIRRLRFFALITNTDSENNRMDQLSDTVMVQRPSWNRTRTPSVQESRFSRRSMRRSGVGAPSGSLYCSVTVRGRESCS